MEQEGGDDHLPGVHDAHLQDKVETARRRARAVSEEIELQEKIQRALTRAREISLRILRQEKQDRERVRGIEIAKQRARKVELPYDIISNIFCYLPLDCYCRMRTVATYFNSTNIKPRPVLGVLARSKHNKWNGLIGVDKCGKLDHWFKFPQLPMELERGHRESDYKLIGACKGLVCFCRQDRSWDKSHCDYVVYNPATSETLYLPELCMELEVVMHGFGVAAGVYKIAAFSTNQRAILTLGDRDYWRISKRVAGFCINLWEANDSQGDGKYSDERLYWIGREKLIVFDLVRECFQELQSPQQIEEENKSVVALGIVDNKLSAFVECQVNTELYTMEAFGVWQRHSEWVSVNATTRMMAYKYGGDERLFVLHNSKLGVLDSERSHLMWPTPHEITEDDDFEVQSAMVIEPTLQSLQELGALVESEDESPLREADGDAQQHEADDEDNDSEHSEPIDDTGAKNDDDVDDYIDVEIE